MSSSTLGSLALLASNWYVNKRDYIENFIPFIATLIKKKNYVTISINEVCTDFQSEFGLRIPYHPMHTILNRSKRRGIIRKENGNFIPVENKVLEYEFSTTATEQLRKYEKVILELIEYAKKKYEFKLLKENAEAAFISFLKEYDLDILFISEEESVLPDVKSSKREKFIIHSFIKNAYESEPDIFKFIVNIAIGHLMANSLVYKEFDHFIGKLKGTDIYLDTRVIFRLLGLEGPERKVVYEEFLKTLSKEKANLYIFKHTYEEAFDILEDSYEWVENSAYDPSLANLVTKYFVQNNYTKMDVRRFINRISIVLEENGIPKNHIVEAPDPQPNIPYQIDERKMRDFIIKTYKTFNPYFEESTKEITIQKDVDSISAIYKLRKGNVPRFLKDVGSLFMTTNSALALSARKFEQENLSNKFCIPACLTDIFLGTILWLQSPTKIFKINEKKIIADCYAALKPNNMLIKRFISELKKLLNEEKINEDEYYFLRSDALVMELLEEKTLGDPDNFDSKMPFEILEEIKAEIRREESQKYFQEKEKYEKTFREYKIAEQDNLDRKESLEKRAKQISVYISKYIHYALVLIFIFGTIFQILPELFKENPKFKIGILVLYALLGVGSFVLSLNVIREKLKIYLESNIIKFFSNVE